MMHVFCINISAQILYYTTLQHTASLFKLYLVIFPNNPAIFAYFATFMENLKFSSSFIYPFYVMLEYKMKNLIKFLKIGIRYSLNGVGVRTLHIVSAIQCSKGIFLFANKKFSNFISSTFVSNILLIANAVLFIMAK